MASRVDDALEKAATLSYDVAVLDVNLNRRQTFEVARCIAERGIAYVFATGYGPASLLADFRHVPILAEGVSATGPGDRAAPGSGGAGAAERTCPPW